MADPEPLVRERPSARASRTRRGRAGVLTALAAVIGLVALAPFTACAPKTQRLAAPPAAFDGPRFEIDRMISFDGAALALQRWSPADEPWAVIVGVHGMSEYADAFYLAGPHWAKQGIAVYAYDQRGFGRSPGRGIWPGVEVMAKDLQTAVRLAREAHPDAIVAVVGESMGAAVTMAAVERSDTALADRIILSAPAVRGWSALPLHYSASLWLSAHVRPGWRVKPPKGVKVTATDNIEALLKNGRDPLYLRETRIDLVYGLVSLMEAASQASVGAREPTLMLYGAKDELVPAFAVERAAAALGPCGRTAFYPDGWHMLLRDLQAPTVWADVEAFIRDPDATPPSKAGPIAGAPPGLVSLSMNSSSCSATLGAEF